MSMLLFRSRPCTSSSSSAPTSAPVFILSWLWIWRCQYIWNTFITAYSGEKHHRRIGKRRNGRQVRVGSTSASYSIFKLCVENSSKIDFLWFSLLSLREKITLRLTKKLLSTSRIPVLWDVALQHHENASDVLKCRVVFIVTCPRHMKNEFFVIVVLDT